MLTPFRPTLAFLALMTFALELTAAEQDWRQVSDFPATGIFASGSQVVAWNMLQYTTSTDGGVSWSNAIAPAPAGQNAEPVRACVAGSTGFLVLTSTGKLLNATATGLAPVPAPAATNLAVDGQGRLYLEGVDGNVTVFGNPAPVANGRIYRAVKDGVLVQGGKSGLALATPSGAQQVKFVGEKLVPAFELPALTTPGGNRWPTAAAGTWFFKDGKVQAFGERQAKVLSYAFGTDGYHELLTWRGLQITMEQGNSGLSGHWRTKNLPQDATVITAAGANFVVGNPRGLFYVPIARE